MTRTVNGLSRRNFVGGMAVLAGSTLAYQALGTAGAARAATVDEALAFESALSLAERVRRREISSVELTRYFIGRIERYDKALNAVPVRDFDRALAAAAAADEALGRGDVLGPLHGLPMTIKESYDIEGLPTTWGNPAWKDNIATADSVVVSRFRGAGAHFMGKTNVPFMLADFQSYNEIYGQTNNPWDPSRTHGIVPRRGQAPPGAVSEPDLEVVGPLARSAGDLQVALDIVAGPDVLTAPGWRLDLPAPRMTSLDGLRVALIPDHDASPVDREVAERVTFSGTGTCWSVRSCRRRRSRTITRRIPSPGPSWSMVNHVTTSGRSSGRASRRSATCRERCSRRACPKRGCPSGCR